MNIRRFFNNYYLTWEEYQSLVYTTAFIEELARTKETDEIRKIGGGENG